MALLAAPRGLGPGNERPTPRQRARALYDQGLEHWARGEEADMLRAMQASWEADPGYLPPIVDAVAYFEANGLPAHLREQLQALASRPDQPIAMCVRALLDNLDGYFVALPGGAAHPECGWYTQLMMHGPYASDRTAVRDAAARLAERYPESPALVAAMMNQLSEATQWDSLLTRANDLARARRHPLVRSIGFAHLPGVLHALGRHDDAMRAERALEAHLRASLPRARFRAVDGLDLGHTLDPMPQPAGWLAQHAESLRARAAAWRAAAIDDADPALAILSRVRKASALLGRGDLHASLAVWDTLVRTADSMGHPGLRAYVGMRRGQTRVKLGDWPEAERDLLAARQAGTDQTTLVTAYEIEHQLLHLYEAQHRDAEARQAGERFVALTRLGGLTPVRMMSRHDYGWFLRRRGEHEAARRHFAAMLADIDSLPPITDLHTFAGEFYESVGDLDRAAAHYLQARDICSACGRTVEALARLAAATGDVTAALAYAREIDASTVRNYPEFRPLVASLLARTGRLAEAAQEFGRARDEAFGQGRAAGWARLSLELAELEAARGALALAAAIADSAAAEAERVADHETAVRARALGGLVRIRRGDSRTGIALLERSLRLARQGQQPQVEADVRLLHGDALAALGRTAQAIAEFDRAAALTDSIALSLAHDPTRAGFRGATQLRVTNRALETIVARPTDAAAARRYVEWSMRRKSRGIIAAQARAPRTRLVRSRLADLKAQLGPDRAVIDYTVLDTAVAALVVTDRANRVVRLPVTADTLRARVAALYARIAPRVGSRVDRARAAFDYDIARALYADLLAPLEAMLGDRTSLTIVPDAPLHVVPFDALVMSGSGAAPVFVLDRYTVTLATSVSGGAHAFGALPAGAVVALSGPAPSGVSAETEREVATIADVMRGRTVRRFVGVAATEGAVRAHASRAAVLHFAAHAQPNAHQPEYGRVTLSPAGEDDGWLHVHEIRQLRLPGSLVVLSACESAAGRLVAGEGPLSLSRAFLQAGASGVVGTLWPVGEAAAELMTAFYQGLAQGRPAPEALRLAKLAAGSAQHPNPLQWAAFQIMNRDRR